MPAHVDLTPAERCVLLRRCAGDAVKAIALEYGRAVSTVRWHIKALHRKTGARSAVELLLWAQEHCSCCLDGPPVRDPPKVGGPQ